MNSFTTKVTMDVFKQTFLATLFHIVLSFILVSGDGTAPHDVDCSVSKDGLHEIGCWGYANCLDGKPVINRCGVNLVFDRTSMTCVKPGTTNTDCLLPVDCAGKPDRSYPDYTDSCVTYYRCVNELNLGRFYCPAQTAFNENLQICDYPQNLPPPCGSKIVPAMPVTTKKTTPKPTTMMPTTTPKMTTQMPTTTMPKTTEMPTTTMPKTTEMPTTTMPKTTQMSTATMRTTTPMPTTTTTTKTIKTSQLHVILSSSQPRPSPTASQSMTTASQSMTTAPAIPVVG